MTNRVVAGVSGERRSPAPGLVPLPVLLAERTLTKYDIVEKYPQPNLLFAVGSYIGMYVGSSEP